MEHQELLQEISTFLQKGRSPKVKELVQKAIDSVLPPKSILEEGLSAGMGIIGEKFKNNEVFVPEVLIAARAMNGGVEVLKPHLMEAGVETKGVVVIGTVKGGLHDIGKNLVKLMMEGKGLEVIDLGIDVAPEQFVAAAKEHNSDIISCSALLTTTMGEMKNVVDLVKADSELSGRVKIMIGGAPVTEAFCRK